MDMKKTPEIQLQLIIMTIGYSINLIMGIAGSFLPPESFWQLTCWQIGDASAIMSSILASRYIATQGLHIVPSGFTLLAIAYGVSIASSSFNSLNEEKMATIILPLVPAILLISLGKFFPRWVRALSIFTCIPFLVIYMNVISGTYSFDDLSNSLAYTGIQILGLIWSFYMWRHYMNNTRTV